MSSSDVDPPCTTFEFNADISKIMSLIVHSLYSNKDIFLRELLSNASDALTKQKIHDLTNVEGDHRRLKIEIVTDKDSQTITITDTGIGMTRNELIDNLGIVANSGTKKFNALKNSKDSSDDLIGQFGVGFYSAFLVSSKVCVYSFDRNLNKTHLWSSEAGGSFEVVECKDVDLSVCGGTRLVLHIKDEHVEYLTSSKLQSLVDKHSKFIVYPIFLQKIIFDEDEDEDEDREVRVKDVVPNTRMVLLNPQPPLWSLSPTDCTEVMYNGFFHYLTGSDKDYLGVKHFKVEGAYSFEGLVYCPSKPPFDMYSQNKNKVSDLKLYVRKVLISEKCSELMPEYLSFIQGVVDSKDLPLNISREILQESKIVKIIRKKLVKKCITMFEDLASSDDQKYEAFYTSYGSNLKLGVYEDSVNRSRLIRLLRFDSSHDEKQKTSLSDYVSRMKTTQTCIYYITGESRSILEHSPMTEGLFSRGFEVLFLTDPMDEYIVEHMQTFNELKVVCASKKNTSLKLSEKDSKRRNLEEVYFKSTCEQVKKILGSKVCSVVLSCSIVDSPCCIVTENNGWTANMERIMNAQALRNSSITGVMSSRKILELNPSHGIICHLRTCLNDAETFEDLANLLFDTALLNSGFTHPSPSEFTCRIYKMLKTVDVPRFDVENNNKDEFKCCDSQKNEIGISTLKCGIGDNCDEEELDISVDDCEDVNKKEELDIPELEYSTGDEL
jgi:molecular chaperone HtpG